MRPHHAPVPLLARTVLPLALGMALLTALTACGGGSHPKETGDVLTDMNNAEITTGRRIEAIEAAWAGVQRGDFDPDLTRRAIGDIAWNRSEPDDIRLAALDAIINDPSPTGTAYAQDLIRLMLPHEESRGVVEYLSTAAAVNNWTVCTPALVRALSNPVGKTDAKDNTPRIERAALHRLNPNRSIEAIAFDVFMDPTPPQVSWSDRYAKNTREDAWDLLARLDPQGIARRELVRTNASADPTVAAVARAERELGIIPITGPELTWMLSLESADDTRAWWSQTASVVARLTPEQRQGLALRHLEPIRWASKHRTPWLAASRQDLYAQLEARLAGRKTHRRTADVGAFGRPVPARLADNAARLAWADLLTILVIDDAIADPQVRAALAGQVIADRRDTTTEYGGVLDAVNDTARFAALPFPPRPSEREHDRKFIASDDMVRAGRTAFAQYHFHVQKARHDAFAGPGEGDLLSAAASGRNNVVFTSINASTLNADYYQPSGVVIDLGEIPIAEPSR